MSLQTNAYLIRRVTLAGMLTALAFALSYLEHFIPVQALVPIPGIKLGLANIVTMFALHYLDKPTAVGILVARCVLQNILFGSVSAFLFSLSGGALALVAMALLFRYGRDKFSLFGISMAGAACHNIGQVLCAAGYFQTTAVLSYLPFLLLLAIPTGFLTGFIGKIVFRYLQRMDFLLER